MLLLDENLRLHLEAFASELFIRADPPYTQNTQAV